MNRGLRGGGQQDSEHKLLCLGSAPLCSQLGRAGAEHGGAGAISPPKWPVLPGIFSEKSSYSMETIPKPAVLSSRLQCRKLRNKNIIFFLMLFVPC